MKRIERILRESTLNMFSDNWYKSTAKQLNETKEDNNTDFYDEFYKFVKENIILNEKYPKNDFYNNIINLKSDYSIITPKRCNLVLKEFCKLNNYKYFEYNSNGVRGFIITK